MCCRNNNNNIQILMVKKSNTYYFCEFVMGRYKKYDDKHLLKLFNNMTYYEKMDILSLRFQTMWYRIYKENPDNSIMLGIKNSWTVSYLKKKGKFDSSFLQDGGSRLRKLINSSINNETPWEFPRGRKDSDKESNIETAIREFKEETNVKEDKFKIIWNLQPYIETYTVFNIVYQNIYYYADSIGIWEPIYKFNNTKQSSEVAHVRWMSISNLNNIGMNGHNLKRMIKCFKKNIAKYKNNNKYSGNNKNNKTYADIINYTNNKYYTYL